MPDLIGGRDDNMLEVLGTEKNCCAILGLSHKVDSRHPVSSWGQSKIAAQFLVCPTRF